MDTNTSNATAKNTKASPDAEPVTERVSNAAHDTIGRVADSAHPVVDKVAQRAHETVAKVANAAASATEGLSFQTSQVRDLQETFVQDCREYVRNNPMRALLYAAAAGFLLTRALRD